MGIYLNPGNESFCSAVRSEIYVDKTGLLAFLNKALGTENRCISVSRPRRFGKSMAAAMIDAYYGRGRDSKALFAPYRIASQEDFETHLNQYHVLHFDVSSFLDEAENPDDTVHYMNRKLLEDFQREFPNSIGTETHTVSEALRKVYMETKIRFVIVVDEWDCMIRDADTGRNDRLITQYLRYLRGLFKTEESKRFLALGYITGILPIKKIEGESAMNNFREYTMTSPKRLAPFFGFTEKETLSLCRQYGMPMEKIRQWYDGYRMRCPIGSGKFETVHIFNPNSIVNALLEEEIGNYWKNTGAFRSLNTYIARNEEGLKECILRMLTGEECFADISTFQNDLASFSRKDDVLAALIHLGYLGYDAGTGKAFIPNEEVRAVFDSAIRVGDWADIRDALEQSDALLSATWEKNAPKVASMIDQSHQDFSSILAYHDENALACAIMLSYYTARAWYIIKREFPAGRGFADIAFLPKQGHDKPAMIVELKWNRSANAAIKQIHDRNYAGALREYRSDILLVGINYSKKTGKHNCKIENVRL